MRYRHIGTIFVDPYKCRSFTPKFLVRVSRMFELADLIGKGKSYEHLSPRKFPPIGDCDGNADIVAPMNPFLMLSYLTGLRLIQAQIIGYNLLDLGPLHPEIPEKVEPLLPIFDLKEHVVLIVQYGLECLFPIYELELWGRS